MNSEFRRPVAIRADFTRRESMDQIREQIVELRSFAFERLSAIAAVLDDSGEIVDTNEAWRLFARLNHGTTESTGPGVNYLSVCDRAAASGADGAAATAAGLRRILAGERKHFDLEYPCSSPTEDRWFMLQASSAPIADGVGVVLFHINITARKVLEDRLSSEAEHDELTGLPNRRAAVAFVDHQIANTLIAHTRMSVLFMDLDGFKAVNDTFGHHAGDELLVQVAARAQGVVRPTDLVCRIGGDEFLVACPGLDADDAAVLAARLRAVMSQPFQVGAAEISIGASVGLAVSGTDSTADTLMNGADTQMYVDKRGRKHRDGVAPPRPA